MSVLGVVFMTYCVFFELFKREWTREKRQRFWLFYLNSLGGVLFVLIRWKVSGVCFFSCFVGSSWTLTDCKFDWTGMTVGPLHLILDLNVWG